MGGYGALRNGLKYNDTFGCIGALSSALILEAAVNSKEDAPLFMHRRSYFEDVFGDLTKLMGSDKDYYALIHSLKERQVCIPRIFMCCGTEDFLLSSNRAYHEFLKEQEVEVHYEEGTGAHDWDYWNIYIRKLLEWLPLDEGHRGINSGNVGI
jgi:S-formylglutathione hydrolase FrmB